MTKVNVISGFLGAGKTTLIKKLLEEALQGASDIVAERISDDAGLRKVLRALYLRRGTLVSRAAEKEPEVDPETGSLLSQADIDAMEAMVEGPSGYYGRMLDHLVKFIQAGVEAGRRGRASRAGAAPGPSTPPCRGWPRRARRPPAATCPPPGRGGRARPHPCRTCGLLPGPFLGPSFCPHPQPYTNP